MTDFSFFISLWAAVALLACIYLFFIDAPYGRHIRDGWGPKISARLGWILMESPCVILMIVYALTVRDQLDTIHEIFLLIWLTHYIHRAFIYPFVIGMSNPKMPFSIALTAFFFNITNVSIQAFGIFYFTQYSSDWMQSTPFIIGILLFVLGMLINIRSDYVIAALRKEKGPGYHLPNKFLHKYVASPNYLGEIIEWTGWALLTWNISGVVFLLWTIANLLPRAVSNLRWYREKFEDYPTSRKALIPGLI
ncbi:MAG: hypothetical protein OSB23_08570 [Porticoccaceae bacterium]|nr:hypothetical protein [Porticoccaceae bacterium]|tara:strand:- start:1738 stop:2487 length:750 start_codon:yes stop_codon:yes gene_type:complete